VEEGMEITMTFRHMEPTAELRSYVEDKVQKIKKYFDSPVDVHIVLGVEKFRHIADLTLSVDGNKIKAVEQTGDMYSSIDKAMNKVEEQLRRMLSRKREYKPENIKGTEGEGYLSDEQGNGDMAAEAEPKVIITEKVDTKPMDADEAAQQMELSKRNFLVFFNSKSNNINVIYKRKDGNLGLIEPVSG
jgi:putative sigma-54 modulation protein